MPPPAPSAPLIHPTTGIYAPSLSVIITADHDEDRGDILFYILEDDQQQKPHNTPVTTNDNSTRRQRYRAPILLNHTGRFKITAFVFRQGYGDGPLSSTLYLLDDDAPSPVEMSTTRRLQQQYAQPDAKLLTSDTMPPEVAKPDALYRDIVASASLQFSKLPAAIPTLTPFDAEVVLVDAQGFPCPLYDYLQGRPAPKHLLMTAERVGAVEERQITTTIAKFRIDEEGERTTTLSLQHQQLPLRRLPPFVLTSNMLVEPDTPTDGSRGLPHQQPNGVRLTRSGRGGLWNSVASTEPCLSATGAFCGFTFRIGCLSRCIVGLYPASTGTTTRVVDPFTESCWRDLSHSFHFSADLTDPCTVPAFRIYEFGVLQEEVGTVEYSVDDCFEIRVRPTGEVTYLRNHFVVHTTAPALVQVEGSTKLRSPIYAAMVRISSQQDSFALRACGLTEPGNAFVVKLTSLLMKPELANGGGSRETEETNKGGGDPDPQVVLRAWLPGVSVGVAMATVPLSRRLTIPRWAVAAVNLSMMFGMGAVGCQGHNVSLSMVEQHQGTAPLVRHVPTAAAIHNPSSSFVVPLLHSGDGGEVPNDVEVDRGRDRFGGGGAPPSGTPTNSTGASKPRGYAALHQYVDRTSSSALQGNALTPHYRGAGSW